MRGLRQSVNGGEYHCSVHNVIRCVLYALEHKVPLQEAIRRAQNEPRMSGFLSIPELLVLLQWDSKDTIPDDFDLHVSGDCSYGDWFDE